MLQWPREEYSGRSSGSRVEHDKPAYVYLHAYLPRLSGV